MSTRVCRAITTFPRGAGGCTRYTLTNTIRSSIFNGGCSRKQEDNEKSKGEVAQGKEVNMVVSSLRIDTVAAAGLDISRKCVELISLLKLKERNCVHAIFVFA